MSMMRLIEIPPTILPMPDRLANFVLLHPTGSQGEHNQGGKL
jgi:hypothetical protein